MTGEGQGGWTARLRALLWETGFSRRPPAEETRGPWRSLVSNGPFFLSAMAFYGLYIRTSRVGLLTGVLTALAVLLGCAVFPDLRRNTGVSVRGRLLAALSAAGAAVCSAQQFYGIFAGLERTAGLAARAGLSGPTLTLGLAVLGGVGGWWFLYVLLCRLYGFLGPVLDRAFSGVGRGEKAAVLLLTLAFMAFAAWAFTHSDAFYRTPYQYDVLYTSDSPQLVAENAWLNLLQSENDLRQPLFAVSAAPFTGAAYLVGLLFPGRAWVTPLLSDCAQLVLLVLAYYLLSSLAETRPAGRLALLACLCSLYATLLFSVMMEQYIVSLFWLVLFLYMSLERLPARGAALLGGAGALVTSAAAFPWMLEPDDLRPVRGAGKKALAAVGSFLFALLFFRRADVLLNLRDLRRLLYFTGEHVPAAGRVLQYLNFVSACLFAPAAGPDAVSAGHLSWQLAAVTAVKLSGAAVLLLCVLGAVLTRREPLTRACAWWCAFSAVLLCLLGWGTAENGLVLYILYFGWAFLLLLRQLAAWALEKCRLARLLPWAEAAFAAVLLGVNLPALGELLRFALKNFPV